MIEIAKRNNPELSFVQGDMRDVKLDNQVESALARGKKVMVRISL